MLIMSLWPVDDEPTRHWDEGALPGAPRGGTRHADSVRQASLEVLKKRRERPERPSLLLGTFRAVGGGEGCDEKGK